MYRLVLVLIFSAALSACASNQLTDEKIAKAEKVEETEEKEAKEESSKRTSRGCGRSTGSRLRTC